MKYEDWIKFEEERLAFIQETMQKVGGIAGQVLASTVSEPLPTCYDPTTRKTVTGNIRRVHPFLGGTK